MTTRCNCLENDLLHGCTPGNISRGIDRVDHDQNVSVNAPSYTSTMQQRQQKTEEDGELIYTRRQPILWNMAQTIKTTTL